MPEFRTVDAGKAKIRAAVEGEGPLVVMVHGFPESWYSWRDQIGPVAQAGFQVAAIDVRGYGGSDKPDPIEAYDMEALTGDVAGVIDALSADGTGVLIGHDWGAPIVWNTALSRPEKIRAVAGLSVPFSGVPQRPFTEIFTEAFTSKGHFFYQAWFTDEELDYYVGEFERSGFRGPISRYRNHERDFAWLQQFKGRKLEMPTLLIGGDRDPAFNGFGRIPDPAAMMRGHVTDLRGVHVLPGVGHWTQQERPAEVTAILLDWLKGL